KVFHQGSGGIESGPDFFQAERATEPCFFEFRTREFSQQALKILFARPGPGLELLQSLDGDLLLAEPLLFHPTVIPAQFLSQALDPRSQCTCRPHCRDRRWRTPEHQLEEAA